MMVKGMNRVSLDVTTYKPPVTIRLRILYLIQPGVEDILGVAHIAQMIGLRGVAEGEVCLFAGNVQKTLAKLLSPCAFPCSQKDALHYWLGSPLYVTPYFLSLIRWQNHIISAGHMHRRCTLCSQRHCIAAGLSIYDFYTTDQDPELPGCDST